MAKKRLSKSSLLWLIRSRSYISVADVRRRFNVEASDDVVAMVGPGGRVYVGLPAHQAKLLEELWRDGKIGIELAPDIKAPIVTGVYGIFRRGEYVPPNGANGRVHEDGPRHPGGLRVDAPQQDPLQDDRVERKLFQEDEGEEEAGEVVRRAR